jgi:hypothetical protein
MTRIRCAFAASLLAIFDVFGLACRTGGQISAEKDRNTPESVAVGAACLHDRDCLSGDFCDTVSHVCVTPDSPAGTIASGDPCTYDAECQAGNVCDGTGVCVADPYASTSQPAAAPCDWDRDCASGLCNLDTHTCD